MQSQAEEVIFHSLFLYTLPLSLMLLLKFQFQPHTSHPVCLLNSSSLMWCSAGSPVSHFSFPAPPLSLCSSEGPVYFIINRPLCRHVLSSQHITLTYTGGILPQFSFSFLFSTKDIVVDGLKKGWMSKGRVRDQESELRKRKKEIERERNGREGCWRMLVCCNAVWFWVRSSGR